MIRLKPASLVKRPHVFCLAKLGFPLPSAGCGVRLLNVRRCARYPRARCARYRRANRSARPEEQGAAVNRFFLRLRGLDHGIFQAAKALALKLPMSQEVPSEVSYGAASMHKRGTAAV